MEYRVEKHSQDFELESYVGYIDDVYAGNVTGVRYNDYTFSITSSHLIEKFQGTKAVRALNEIIKGVMNDYDVIRTRIDNKDNAEIKIVLNAGFHIIGTVTYGSEIAVELLKIKEE